MICGAYYTDTIEDTDTSEEELLDQFGVNITRIVLEVTDDKTLEKNERKELRSLMHPYRIAKLVKLADKISNLRDIANSPPHGWNTRRKQEYFDWAARVVEGIKGTHEQLESLFDQAYGSDQRLSN